MRHAFRIKLLYLSIAFACAMALSSQSAWGQSWQTPDVEQGAKPYGDFHGGDIDQVSLSSGKLILNIPLVSYPQRGGKINVAFGLRWETPRPRDTETCLDTNNACSESSFRDTPPTGKLYFTDDLGWSAGTFTDNTGSTYASATGPDQARHYLASIGGNQYRSMDAAGLLYNASNVTLTTSDGLRYIFAGTNNALSKIEDANGNFVTPTATGWTDTFGRSITSPNYATSTTNYSGCTGTQPITSATVWTVPAPAGGTETFKFCYATYSYNWTVTPGGQDVTFQGSLTMLQSIVLPNNTTWTFNYDSSYASLSQITLPTGGTISYTSALVDAPCSWYSTYNASNGKTTNHYAYYLAVASRSVNANDGAGNHTWIYTGWTTTGGTVKITDPLSNDSLHVMTGLDGTGSVYETQTTYYQGSSSSGALLKTVATDYRWQYLGPVPYFGSTNPGWNGAPPLSCQQLYDVAPIRVTTTWANNQVTKQETDYDSGFTSGSWNLAYGQVAAVRDYDYASGAPGPLLRQVKTTYVALSGPNASSYLANNLISLPYTVQTLSGSSTQVALTQYNYDESARASSGLSSSYQWDSAPPTGTYRGNNTSVYRWLNSGSLTCPSGSSGGSGSNIISYTTYFDSGNVQTSKDPCGNITTYAYSLTYWGALPTTIANALSQAANNTYDFNTGLLTSSTDPNNLQTSYGYDNMRRLASVTAPDGAVTNITHQETSFPFTATVNKPINASQTETTTNLFDGLGRVKQTQLNSDPQGVVYTDTTYDALGRVSTVSNPYRTGADITTTTGTTTYGYDALSRKTSETFPDNSVLGTAYCGPSTLVTDPTNRWRRSRVDGLGRLVEVDEPNSTTATVASSGCPGTGEPIWVTSYTLDALGNLTNVVQNGSRSRSFTCDSLSRLVCSSNPENSSAACPAFGATSFPSGTVTYTYWPHGPLHTKLDARSITTTYAYDALLRQKSASYSNGDPTISTNYDESNCLSLSSCQNIGHRTSMTDAAGSEIWAYQVDAANHRSVHKNQRTTSSITKTSTYYLDYTGNVTQAVYPTGRTVNYTYDNADRPSTAADSANGITYATGFKTSPGGTCANNFTCYTPQGTFYALSIGQTSTFNGVNLTHIYNTRFQPQEFKASSTGGSAIDISYSYADPLNAYKNAGHVFSITNNLDNTRSQNFTYDQLNRISGATTASTYSTSPSHCWGEAYGLDAWGNLQSISPTTLSGYTGCSQEAGFSQTAGTNNRLSGFSYDASGNTSSDGVNSYTWDAENQLKAAAGVTYLYDGEGRRAAKVGSKLYWYGSGDEILAETSTSGTVTAEYIFFGGKRIAMLPPGGNPTYYVEDMLGTSRVLTTNAGVVCYDADFYPYGGERPYTNTCPQNYKFEGKERDVETGNDDFGARYYSNRFGRWLSADWSAVPAAVPYANLSNPQTLNLYSMVADDPESFADLDGHDGDREKAVDFIAGFLNGLASDNGVRTRMDPQGDQTFASGQTAGDVAAVIQGGIEMVLGGGGEVGGLALDGTGVGAAAGVPINIASAGLIAHGGAVELNAGRNLIKTVVESRRVGDLTPGEKKQMDQQNANANSGQNKCTECGQDVQKVQNKKGATPPENQLQRHHDPLLSRGGSSKSKKNRIVCRKCHVKIHKKSKELMPKDSSVTGPHDKTGGPN